MGAKRLLPAMTGSLALKRRAHAKAARAGLRQGGVRRRNAPQLLHDKRVRRLEDWKEYVASPAEDLLGCVKRGSGTSIPGIRLLRVIMFSDRLTAVSPSRGERKDSSW